jgi:carbon monoxide dehydrogenase subunit G
MRRILPCLSGITKVYMVSRERLNCRIRIREGPVKGTFDADAHVAGSGGTITLSFTMNGILGSVSGTITAAISQAGTSVLIVYQGDIEIKGLAAAIASDLIDATVDKFVRTVMDCLLSGKAVRA